MTGVAAPSHRHPASCLWGDQASRLSYLLLLLLLLLVSIYGYLRPHLRFTRSLTSLPSLD